MPGAHNHLHRHGVWTYLHCGNFVMQREGGTQGRALRRLGRHPESPTHTTTPLYAAETLGNCVADLAESFGPTVCSMSLFQF